jgi:hypothetical protein
LSWEDVERHYKQALEAFEELEESKAVCVLGLPVSQDHRTNQRGLGAQERRG